MLGLGFLEELRIFVSPLATLAFTPCAVGDTGLKTISRRALLLGCGTAVIPAL